MHLLAVSVGNTRTRLGVFRGRDLDQAAALDNTDLDAIVAAIRGVKLDRPDAPVVLASVNNPVADRLEQALAPHFKGRLHRFGRDLQIPLTHNLEDASTTGQDRLLNALAAFRRTGEACVVVDCGTAMTVDFIDAEGVFQGGAIAPGVSMMLKALRASTAALPEIPLPAQGDPPLGPFGKDTRQAMLLGVRAAAVGLVHRLVERYAEAHGAYPRVLATGGNARWLFEAIPDGEPADPIVERIVPDLTLIGIHAACEALMESPAE